MNELASLQGMALELGKIIAREVVTELRGGQFADLVDQHASPLGARRHIKLCRANPDRCVQAGRRYLAPKDLVAAELAKPKPARAGDRAPSRDDQLTADLAKAREIGL